MLHHIYIGFTVLFLKRLSDIKHLEDITLFIIDYEHSTRGTQEP